MLHTPSLTEQVNLYIQDSIYNNNGVPPQSLLLEVFAHHSPTSVRRVYHQHLDLARAINRTYNQARNERIRNRMFSSVVIAGLLVLTATLYIVTIL